MKEAENQVKNLNAGDLIRVEWFDASVGKSLSGGLNGIDIPVVSWGIFIGVLGRKNKHIVLAQNNFHYADGLYDIDYTAIPIAWTTKIQVIAEKHVNQTEAEQLLNSFLKGGGNNSFSKGTRQKTVKNHERLD